MRDVIFHLADRNIEEGLRAFFRRDNWHHALGCSRFEIDPESNTDLYRVPGHTDGGLWKHAHENLLTFKGTYRHAVIVLDEDFDPHPGARILQADISSSMIGSGWDEDRFAVTVIQPELEAWLWAPNVNVARAFGHTNFNELRASLEAEGFWNAGDLKPHDLKGARNRAAKLGGKKTGGPIFRSVFEHVSRRALDDCEEPGLKGLRRSLSAWFPTEANV
jgi:hypothetical protein